MKKLHLTAGLIAGILSSSHTGWSLAIQPGAQVVTAKVGEQKEVSVEIINDQDNPLDVSCSVKDSVILPENKGITARDWLTPKMTQATVAAKSSVKMPLLVQVPTQAKGELAAFVSCSPIVEEKKPDHPSSTQTKVVTMISVSLYVRIEGTTRGQADLTALLVENVEETTDRPASIRAAITVKNTGNVHQRPSGEFKIFRRGDKTPLHTVSFPTGWPVMAYSEYPYEAFVAGQLPEGNYEVVAQVVYTPQAVDNKKIRFSIDKNGKTVNVKEK